MNIPVRQSLPVYTTEEIRQIEAEFASPSSPSLMERAGLSASKLALSLLKPVEGEKVLVMAGPGNNGGDGFVLARHLQAAGCFVQVVCLGDLTKQPQDAQHALDAWIQGGGQTLESSSLSDFATLDWHLVVDALFGIGLQRSLQAPYLEWVAWVNTLTCPVLALDIPSGLNAQTGCAMGAAVQASHTLTFIGLKAGLLTAEGVDLCGQLILDDLDLFPRSTLVAPFTSARCIGLEDFCAALKPRRHNTHKGSYGQAGIVGGAAGMQGAALLAGRAALKLGAGRVYVGLLESSLSVDFIQPELMLRSAKEVLSNASALSIGVGLGQSHAAKMLVESALAFSGALVLDADALNLIGMNEDLQTQLAQRSGDDELPSILTPHPAEAARLLQISVEEVQKDRVASALTLAARYQAYVVLKGCGSVIALPQGGWHINASGHAGLATAGSGDVLTGMLTSLLAQGWSVQHAIMCAVHLHGVSAEFLSTTQNVGIIGMTAGELIDAARFILNRWTYPNAAKTIDTH